MPQKTTNRPPEIITHFARRLSHILAEHLAGPEQGNKRHPFKDRFALKLMLSLSQARLYREELLFRDYSQQPDELWVDYVLPGGGIQKLHTESIFYVGLVLGKPLQLVAKHKSLPTNLHLLLLMLCRYSLDTHWLRTWVKRKHEPATDIHEAFFNPVAKLLKGLCQRLKTVPPLVQTYQQRYGALYLTAGQNRAEIPAEISLLDVVEVVPSPLNAAIKLLPVWYPSLVERILLSLNEAYGLLRSCGLPPQEFWDELSIVKLRELKQLKTLAEPYLESRVKISRYDAFEQAFSTLQDKKSAANAQDQAEPNKPGKIAGFDRFLEFAGSKVGARMLQIFPDSLGHGDGEEPPIPDPQAPPENNSEALRQALSAFLEAHIGSFSPLVKYYYEQAVIAQRPPNGAGSFLHDAGFRKRVAADKKFATLDDDQLQTQLFQTLAAILKKHHFQDWLER